jgi:hypothetical protein
MGRYMEEAIVADELLKTSNWLSYKKKKRENTKNIRD